MANCRRARGVLFAFGMHLFAIAPMNVVKFNEGWPGNAEAIPGMTSVSTITSSGPYSWAIGSQGGLPSKISFYSDNHWQASIEVANLPGISKIVPLYNDGTTAQAFALGTGKMAYFDGATWGEAAPVYHLKNIRLLTSKGHAFVINSTMPISSSFFDKTQETWEPPVDLSATLSSIKATATTNGVIYLLGLNANSEVTMMSSSDNQHWHSKNFGIVRPQNMQIVAGDNHVFVATFNNDTRFFSYSQDGGKTWRNASWPEGMLFSSVKNGILWDMEGSNFAYFDSNLSDPIWQVIKMPIKMTQITTYSEPSITGAQICVTGIDSSGAILECYDININAWQNYPSLSEIANQLDSLFVLANNQFVAMGSDKQDRAALFYYNSAMWQVAYVDGLLTSVQNLFFNSLSLNLWAVGHN